MNEQDFREWFALSDDIIIKTYPVTYGEMTERVTMLYCEGMVRTDMINGLVLPKMQAFVESDFYRNEDAMDVSSMLKLVQLTGNQMISDMKLAVYAGQLILFLKIPKLYMPWILPHLRIVHQKNLVRKLQLTDHAMDLRKM